MGTPDGLTVSCSVGIGWSVGLDVVGFELGLDVDGLELGLIVGDGVITE